MATRQPQGGEACAVTTLHAGNLWETVSYAPPPPERVLDADAKTPDDWVPRSPELIRLTGAVPKWLMMHHTSACVRGAELARARAGRHPLNCEPPLSTLLSPRAWPLTPPALLYVRNHGRVPRIDAAQFRLLLRVPSPGGVREREFSMEELRAMPSRSVAATLACAGLRRKEVAMLAPVDGFNWGAASLGTCVWTGVPLADVLRGAGVTEPSDESQFVCFTGAPGEVPLGQDGTYGTSIPLAVALDPTADVLLAYEHNGEALTPDHGFPLRALVPGYIGGRSVKWLATVEVTAQPSRSYYHTHDNRILPPDVDHARADAEGWWEREEYLFNEFNVNSAIATPAHDERVALAAPGGGPQHLTLRGWAYSGGGQAVSRVELTFDGGATWHLAALPAPRWERGTQYGRHWCATDWSFHVADARELLLCDEVAVRAHDAANNTQPEHVTWNLKGMGNNAWYRVRVHKERCASAPGGVALRFEAPVQPDGLKGGWMGHVPGGYHAPARPQPSELALEAPATPKQEAEHATPGGERKSSSRRVSRAELAQHSKEEDCWVAIAGKVYNPTAFLKDHPGGAFPIVSNAGRDATDEFESIHSPHAWRMLDDYLVGELEPPKEGEEEHPAEKAKDETAPWVTLPPSEVRRVSADGLVALNPHKRLPFTLLERLEVNHDTRIFRFALPSPEHGLGLPPGTHIFLSANIADHRVVRPYTPITPGGTKGHFDLLIKVYFPTAERPGGLMSMYLDALPPGASLHVRGPLGHIEYVGRGLFFVQDAEWRASDVGFVAGGTGLTPVYQVLQAAAADPDDATRMSLIYCNKTPADILLRKELDELAAARPDRLRVWYVVDKDEPPGPGDDSDSKWEHSTGLLSADVIAAHLPPAAASTAVFLCGPPGMERAARKMLKQLGYDESRTADF